MYCFRSLFTVLLLAITATRISAQWAYYGPYTATPTATNAGTSISMATSKTGDCYVFYSEAGWSNRGTVVKSPLWSVVGPEPCTPGAVAYCNIVLDSSGTPFIAFQDGNNANKVTVMKYDGSSWVNVGSAGFSPDAAYFVSLAIDRTGKPWVAYQDAAHSNKATVMKYDGSGWVTVGAAGFSSTAVCDVSLALDTANTPYIAYCSTSTGDGIGTAMKYNGTSWTTMGDIASLGAHLGKTVIAIDTGAVPYLAFIYNDANGVFVTSYDAASDSWQYAGPNPIGGFPSMVSMTMGKNGTPYVMFDDGHHGGASTVMQYDGISWRSTGNIDFSGSGYPTSAAKVTTDDTGNVYALWKWTTLVSYASVSKLEANTSTIIGNLKICAGDTATLTGDIAGGSWGFDWGGCSCITIDAATGKATGTNPGGTKIVQYNVGGNVQEALLWVLPTADSITGMKSLCQGSHVSLSDDVSNGVWSSSAATIAGIGTSGIVTGISAGTATITYTLSDPYGCGSAVTTVTINPQPAAISGAGEICVGSTLTLNETTTGGTWSSGAAGIATVDAATGEVTAMSVGTAEITYTLPAGCYTTTAVTVNCLTGIPTVGTVNFDIYPNPASNELTIRSQEPVSDVTITSLVGQIVFKNATATHSLYTTIDISQLPAGTYLVKINGNSVRKFTKL